MGIAAGVVDRVYTHTLRRGAARDIAHLHKSDRIDASELAFNPEVVRRSLGHAPAAFDAGTTDDYIGEPDIDYPLLRPRAQITHNRERQFAADGVDLAGQISDRITMEEVQEWERAKAAEALADDNEQPAPRQIDYTKPTKTLQWQAAKTGSPSLKSFAWNDTVSTSEVRGEYDLSQLGRGTPEPLHPSSVDSIPKAP